jgi:fluoride exporter
MMTHVLIVGLGGFLGSICRYLASQLVQSWSGRNDLPLGTLVVNIIGCLIIGVLSQLADARGALTAETRLFVIVGILGGFTTFSSFGNETVDLWRNGATNWALLNVTGHLLFGIGAVIVGRWAGQVWFT